MKLLPGLLSAFLSLLATPAIHAADAASTGYFLNREDVRAFIAEQTVRNNLDATALETAFAAAVPLPKVIDLIKPPSQPGVRSWKRYRSRFIESARISAGIQFWQTYEAALKTAEKKYGVPAEVIAGIIGVETIYGRNTGNFEVLSALATLAFDYPPRSALFTAELESLFLLAREQKRDVLSYRGSFAGAIGLPQFLPSSIRTYAVDGNSDGKVDLQNSAEDAIESVANFLANHGWERGGRIVESAHVPEDIDPQALIDADIKPTLSVAQIKAAGIQTILSEKDPAQVALVDFITPGEATQYWLGFNNFYVITRYNRSSFYAMAVNDLAQALRIEHDARVSLVTAHSSPNQAPRTQTKRTRAAKDKLVRK